MIFLDWLWLSGDRYMCSLSVEAIMDNPDAHELMNNSDVIIKILFIIFR